MRMLHRAYVKVTSHSHSDKWCIPPFDLKPPCIPDVGVKYFVVVQTPSVTG